MSYFPKPSQRPSPTRAVTSTIPPTAAVRPTAGSRANIIRIGPAGHVSTSSPRSYRAASFRRTRRSPAVEDFYRKEFWEPIGGDAIEDRALAWALFDCAVNLGVTKAVWFLQRALNALSKNGSLSGYLETDRVWGPATARALRAQLAAKGSAALLKMIDGMRTGHYLNLIEHDPTQGRFAHGWLARVGRQAP